MNYFYPRSPCGERRDALAAVSTLLISIHALLAESDGDIDLTEFNRAVFLSTLSLRRATGTVVTAHTWQGDFYPRSPCGERRNVVNAPIRVLGISIHALLAESDLSVNMRNTLSPVFLSTLSLRRATQRSLTQSSARLFLSTLSLRRATPR